jgi:2-oxoglutarate dehydrogenase E1 component
MYQAIAQHPSVRKLWASQLEQRGVIPSGSAEEMVHAGLDALQKRLETLDLDAYQEPIPPPPPPGAARSVNTAVPAETLRELNRALTQLPEGFTLNSRLARIRSRRDKMLDGDPDWPSIDWATAEELALATVVSDGVPVRLTGQDVERGTFSSRHAVLHDAASGATYTPLQALPQARAAFEIHNSPLSEYAALGFEFGYNIQAGDALVIWEAQYGDFVNNAQTVVDEFIVSARDKWGQLPSLVMLLPHGYEGQGPDHSSGRLERFLALAADNNLRVANCTTSANYFHLLRRQAYARPRRPLVVLTPKSMLRLKSATSAVADFTNGRFEPVIDDARITDPSTVQRVLLHSGKLHYDLLTELEKRGTGQSIALVRLEQLAPTPVEELNAALRRYPNAQLVWVQDEPENQGAWPYFTLEVVKHLEGRTVSVVSRPASAATASGSSKRSATEQAELIEKALAL